MNSHFLTAIEDAAEGRVVELADEMLREIVSAVIKTGKPGALTLTLKVKPNGEQGLEVTPDLSPKIPTQAFPRKYLFADPQSNLTKKMPDRAAGALFDRKNVTTIKGSKND